MASHFDPVLEQLYKEGRWDELWAAAVGRLNANPRDGGAWLLTATCAAKTEKYQELLALMEALSGMGGDPVALTHDMARDLLDGGDYAVLQGFEAALPRDNLLWIIIAYFSACATMMEGRHDEAMAKFKLFRAMLPHFAGPVGFIENSTLNVIFRQGRLVAGRDDIAARMTAAPVLPQVTFSGAVVSGSAVVFAAANSLYFNAMAADFVAGVLPLLGDATLHLHIIDPDAQALALAQSLTDQHKGRVAFSQEGPPSRPCSTYYACARFFVLGQVLDHYRRSVLSLDIDILPMRPVADFLDEAGQHDFRCFVTDRNEPASLYQASIMLWADTAATRAFLDSLQKFCWEELNNPPAFNWMLDQAALFSLIRAPRTDVPPLRFGNYAELLGSKFTDTCRTICAEDQKNSLKAQADNSHTGGAHW